MARTKQTVQDKWKERKGLPRKATAEAGSSADAEEAPHVAAEPDDDESDEAGSESEHEVDSILGERTGKRGKTEYRVKWGSGDLTWEPLAHIEETVAFDVYERKKKEGDLPPAAENEEDADDAEEDAEEDGDSNESESEESDEKPRRGTRRKREDPAYKDTDDSESESESDDDDEYVPEGGGGGGRRGTSSKRRKVEPRVPPINDRQRRRLADELRTARPTTLCELIEKLVSERPNLYGEVLGLLKSLPASRDASAPTRRVVDDDDDDDDDEDEDDEENGDHDDAASSPPVVDASAVEA